MMTFVNIVNICYSFTFIQMRLFTKEKIFIFVKNLDYA